jgi:hypothetical protein
VEFCDLAGLRAIVRLAAAERTVVLHGLAAQLQTLLGIMGWDGTPGLVIDNQPSGLRPPSAARPCSVEQATRDQQRRHMRL